MLPKKESLPWSSSSGIWKEGTYLKTNLWVQFTALLCPNRGVWGLSFSSPVSVVSIKMSINRDCWCGISGRVLAWHLGSPLFHLYLTPVRGQGGREERKRQRRRENPRCRRLILSKRPASQESMDVKYICLDPSLRNVFYIMIQQSHITKTNVSQIDLYPMKYNKL